MAEHPLARVARIVSDEHGELMEFRERPFGRGAEIRLWLPSLTAVGAVHHAARQGGMAPQQPVGHLDQLGATTYNGWQLTITIPVAMVASARDAMARALPAAPPGLPPGPRELGTISDPQRPGR